MKYLIATLILFLIACDKDPIDSHGTNNPAIKVDFLFENDGCKIYRFFDGIDNHYYTNCTSTSSIKSCGKNCRYEENIGGHR